MTTADLIARVERAHSTFQFGALRALRPQLRGTAIYEALARELLRDSTYLQRMRRRMRRGAKLVEDKHPEGPEREERMQGLMQLELRYLQQHAEAASWRMARDTEMREIRSQDDRGAYWLLDKGKRTHTPDCLAMAGKAWSWRVLESVNPGNRHPGCGCRLISIKEAEGRGLRTKPLASALPALLKAPEHLQEASERLGHGLSLLRTRLREAAGPAVMIVPIRPGQGGDKYRDAQGRFAHGIELAKPKGWSRALDGPMQKVLDSIAAGQVGDARFHLDEFNKAVNARFKEPLAKAKAAKAAQRPKTPAHEKAKAALIAVESQKAAVKAAGHNAFAIGVNPGNVRTVQGVTQDIGGESVAIPVRVHPRVGILDAWGVGGQWRWYVPDGPDGIDAETAGRFTDFHELNVKRVKGGYLLETRKGLNADNARASARILELGRPHLVAQRMVDARTPYEDLTHIGLGAKESNKLKSNEDARYLNIDKNGIGVAAESLLHAVAERLKQLTGPGGRPLVDPNGEVHWPEQEDPGNPIDWIINGFAIEMKGGALADADPDAPVHPPSITKEQKRTKQREIRGTGLKPVLAQALIDLPADRAYVFWRPYQSGDEKFTARRVPVELTRRLFRGELQPGDSVEGTVFVGAFPLSYNPHRREREIKPGVQMDRPALQDAAVDIIKRVGPRAPVDLGPGPTRAIAKPSDPPVAKELGEVDHRVLALWNQGISQNEISRILTAEGLDGVSQPNIGRILRRNGVTLPGRGKGPRPGKRADRKGKARPKSGRRARARRPSAGGPKRASVGAKESLAENTSDPPRSVPADA